MESERLTRHVVQIDFLQNIFKKLGLCELPPVIEKRPPKLDSFVNHKQLHLQAPLLYFGKTHALFVCTF